MLYITYAISNQRQKNVVYINTSAVFTGPGLLLRGGRYDIALWSCVHQSQHERTPVLWMDHTMSYHVRGGTVYSFDCPLYVHEKNGLLT